MGLHCQTETEEGLKKQSVRLTNYHLDKGGLVAEALLHQLQQLGTKTVHLIE